MPLVFRSLACDGRSLPLMSCVVPSSQTANADEHERFLESLAECFSPGADVIVITDAGFQGRWFQQLCSHGWIYIFRVLGNHYYNVGDGWEKVSDSDTKASTTAIYLGEGLVGRDKNAQHEGNANQLHSKRTRKQTSGHKVTMLHGDLQHKDDINTYLSLLVLYM